ncbi:MAG: hypothetical protein BGO76_08875 [Caedibacter sp. 38-128]|nr:MAG: hypothetical protein BGO76_08875 [Caedibacter sp. 38-128]
MKIQIKANILELRLYVGVLAYIATFIGSIAFAQDVWHIPIIYIVFAILFDQMTRIIVSSPIDEKDLSEKYKITPDQLNAYVKSKRNYRIFAAGIATIIAFFMSLFNYKFGFCLVISCMAIWCFYPFYRFFFLKIPAPKMQNDKSSYGPQRNDSYNNWPNVPSFAMNRITPGTVEWHSNQNRIR